jgi:hypothetical protein
MILGPQNRCRNPGCSDEPCHKASSESNQTSDEIQFEIPLRILDFGLRDQNSGCINNFSNGEPKI